MKQKGSWGIGIRNQALVRSLLLMSGVLLLIGSDGFQARADVFDPPCTAADFIDAVNNANGNAEADIINLPTGCTVNLTATDNTDGDNGNNGVPGISTEITVNGNGGTIQRDPSSGDSFRIFYVADTGGLTLNDITIQNGLSPGGEGAGIYSSGTLNISNSIITKNENIDYGGGGIYHNGSASNIADSTVSDNRTSKGGGGIRCAGAMTISNSTISDNNAGTGGGGIRLYGGAKPTSYLLKIRPYPAIPL